MPEKHFGISLDSVALEGREGIGRAQRSLLEAHPCTHARGCELHLHLPEDRIANFAHLPLRVSCQCVLFIKNLAATELASYCTLTAAYACLMRDAVWSIYRNYTTFDCMFLVCAALLVWFFGVAFPFYGVINSFMGSYAGSLTAFILPAGVYIWYGSSKVHSRKSPFAFELQSCG